MADTVIGGVTSDDVAIAPIDEGLPGIADDNEDWNSAGLAMLLAQAVQSGSYARSDAELDFASHDGTNDTVDVQPGTAYIALAGETVDVQTTYGGGSIPAYDQTITASTMPAVCVMVNAAQTVDLQAGTLSQVWLAYATDGTVTNVSAGDVYLRSDDTGSVTAPPHPSVELGEANPDNASADTLKYRFGSPTYNDATIQDLLTLADAATDPTANGEIRRNSGDVKVQSGGSVRNLSVVGTEPNEPAWTEDANSPVNSTGAQSATITLDGTYDLVLIHIQEFADETGSQQQPQLRVDGDTGSNYEVVDANANTSTGLSGFELRGSFALTANQSISGTVKLTGDNASSVGLYGPIGDGEAGGTTVAGKNSNVSLPLDSLTFRGSNGNITVRARVYGWTGGLT